MATETHTIAIVPVNGNWVNRDVRVGRQVVAQLRMVFDASGRPQYNVSLYWPNALCGNSDNQRGPLTFHYATLAEAQAEMVSRVEFWFSLA